MLDARLGRAFLLRGVTEEVEFVFELILVRIPCLRFERRAENLFGGVEELRSSRVAVRVALCVGVAVEEFLCGDLRKIFVRICFGIRVELRNVVWKCYLRFSAK